MTTQLPLKETFKAVQRLGSRGSVARGLSRSPQREEAEGLLCGVEGAVLSQLMRCLHLRSPARSSSEPSFHLRPPPRTRLGDLHLHQLDGNARRLSRIMSRAKEMNTLAERVRRNVTRAKPRYREFRTFPESEPQPPAPKNETLSFFKKPATSDFTSYRDMLYDIFSKTLSFKNKSSPPPEKKVRPQSPVPCLYAYLSAKVSPENEVKVNNDVKPQSPRSISFAPESATVAENTWKQINPSPLRSIRNWSFYDKIRVPDTQTNNMSTLFTARYRERPSSKSEKNRQRNTKGRNQTFEKLHQASRPQTIPESKQIHQVLIKNNKVIKRSAKKSESITEGKPFLNKAALKELPNPPRKKMSSSKLQVERKRSSYSRSASARRVLPKIRQSSSATAYDPSSSHRQVFDRFFQKLHGSGSWHGEGRVGQRSVNFVDYTPTRREFLKNKPRSPFHKSPDRSHGIRAPHSPSSTDAKSAGDRRLARRRWHSEEWQQPALTAVRQGLRNVNHVAARYPYPQASISF